MGGIFRKPKKRTPPEPPAPRREETAKKTAPDQKKDARTGTRGGLSMNFNSVEDEPRTTSSIGPIRNKLDGSRA